jgi:hypothetical protein
MAFADRVLLPLYLQIAWGNILEFRKKNWRFDVIGGVVYFVLVFSMFPQVEHLTLCAYRIESKCSHKTQVFGLGFLGLGVVNASIWWSS